MSVYCLCKMRHLLVLVDPINSRGAISCTEKFVNLLLSFFSNREYETGAKMTSRFGKTYSRKGGNGSSKFDEVFSNKRTTLSTKWGETTFMAKLGQKRPSVKPDISEVPKKPKVEDEVTEDPFGFDSDEESLPVSSKNLSQAKSSSQLDPSEAAQSEDFASLLEANSRINQPDSGENIASSKQIPFDNTVPLLKEKSASKNVEDGESKGSSAKLVAAGMFTQFYLFFSILHLDLVLSGVG